MYNSKYATMARGTNAAVYELYFFLCTAYYGFQTDQQLFPIQLYRHISIHHLVALPNPPSTGTTTATMSILLAFILVQLCAMYVSGLAIPPITPTTTLVWDMQRATSFKALVEAAHHVTATDSNTREIEHTPTPSMFKVSSTTTASPARRSDLITKVPSGGMQCAVM
jgi:hypothetical protein